MQSGNPEQRDEEQTNDLKSLTKAFLMLLVASSAMNASDVIHDGVDEDSWLLTVQFVVEGIILLVVAIIGFAGKFDVGPTFESC